MPKVEIEQNIAYEEIIRKAIEYLNQGSIGELSEMCRQAIAIDEGRCEGFFLLAIAAYLVDDLGRAIELASQGHSLSPDCNEVNDLLAHLHAHAGKPNESVYYAKLDSVGTSNPLLSGVQVSGLDNLGKAMSETQEASYKFDAMRAFYEERYDDAIRLFEKELRLRSGDSEFFRLFGVCLCKAGEVRRGIAALHGAVHMAPDNAENFLYLGNGFLQLGDFDMARTCYDRALQLADNRIDIIAGISCSFSPYMSDWPAFDEAVKAWRGNRKAVRKLPKPSKTRSKKKSVRDAIRVGYLLDRAMQCDALRLIEPVLWNYDREEITYYVYSTGNPDDQTAKRLSSLVTSWIDIRDVSDDVVIQTMKHHNLDILVDMTLTAKGQRYDAIASKPAPRIFKWPGRMQDSFSFLYHGPLPDNASPAGSCVMENIVIDSKHMPTIDGKSPFHTRGAITFASTADLARVTPDVVMTWANILRRVPESHLLLGNVQNITSAVEARFMDMFASAGIVDRVQFEPLTINADDGLIVSRLKFLVGADIYLDPFPCSGFIELADALWAGIPVVSLATGEKDTIASAIMDAAACPEWIVEDKGRYIDLAVSMASKVAENPDWRVDMHNKIKQTALFQPEMWKEAHCKLLKEIAGAS